VTLGLVLTTPIIVGGALVPDDLMPALFGAGFAGAAAPFAIPCVAAAISLMSPNFGNVLMGGRRRAPLRGAVTLGAVLTFAFDFAMIPPLGLEGAAIGTVLAEAVVIGYLIVRFRRIVGPISVAVGTLARGVGATALMAGVLVLMPDAVSAVVRIAAAVTVFGAAIIAFGVTSRAELARVRTGR
jgi:O-antigen/teichoic acid export membrane protein